MQPDTVMTLRITARPFEPLGPGSAATSKWEPLFTQLTPEQNCIEGFETEEDARACGQALKKWMDKRGIKGLARATKRNSSGQPCVWLLYEKPPTTAWKPEQPATFTESAMPKAKTGRPAKEVTWG